MRALALIAVCLIGCVVASPRRNDDPLAGRTICVDPGHGGTAEIDSYRVGPTGEREEWINLRVA
ncbi:MAG: hypothetical protein LJE93_02405, partial [Acidobacteria bacterium]|nr:hypothetical protein [Acidobacteriota bacterium]